MRFTYHFEAYRHVSHGIKLVLRKVSRRLPFHVFFPLATVKMSGSYVVGGEGGLITRYYVRAVLSLRVCAK